MSNPTRYVYVVVDRGESASPYADMALLSAVSVRGVDPAGRVTVVADAATASALRARRHPLLDAVDDVLAPPVDGPPVYASRLLKTTLLQRLQTPFVFLDGDTVTVRPIGHRLARRASLQMAEDRFYEHPRPTFPDWVRPFYARMGWRPTQRYYNSGVCYVRDDADAGRVFEQWHDRWRAFAAATGKMNDQPALNSAVEAVGCRVGRLPVRYNAMVKVRERFRWGARTLHFFADTGPMDECLAYGRLLGRVRRRDVPTAAEVVGAMRARQPLCDHLSVGRRFVAGDVAGGVKLFYRLRREAAANAAHGRAG